MMIQKLSNADFDSILDVVNDAAQAYKGIIPQDRWKEPYMSASEFEEEIESGVQFYGWKEDKTLIGVMGIQPIDCITLIRHAYVLTKQQRRGVGERLLNHLLGLSQTREILVGTWTAARWAIDFYQKHGFTLTAKREGERLLRKYWKIPERQIETSVVLRFTK